MGQSEHETELEKESEGEGHRGRTEAATCPRAHRNQASVPNGDVQLWYTEMSSAPFVPSRKAGYQVASCGHDMLWLHAYM